ncbi:PHA/PHB synthase family protein [Bordetella genomosp. 12]|uniref:Poly-beta-hydroxybutyrate polymerase n=1 Tax=Bordetella genomosp. 12 TaxID=463035 RepID=A0A261VMH6_9BORD|nr:alpha/beta fold hydrolase [Bordetella genomosp. 12]OZI74780.1 poly-beta-hydroxybutyrate polymerase [Bordetella genomosp. 12]
MSKRKIPSHAHTALDRAAKAALARCTASLSPAAGLLAWMDWACHLANAPGTRLALGELAFDQATRLGQAMAAGASTAPDPALDTDRRFSDPAWQQWPFTLYRQQFLLTQQWWDAATRDVPGVQAHHAQLAAFAARQWLDMFSPGNAFWTNPQVLRQTWQEGGANLARGARHALEDALRELERQPPAGADGFRPGKAVALTPGKVVFRNRLIELLQYEPATAKVHPEPLLVVPAWIMKYYILDLSPHNSLIRYLVDQGYTVFCISWKNPDASYRDLGMDEYLAEGVDAALGAVNAIVPGQRIHAAGYCLGGTLLAIAAAALAREGDTRLATLSLFTAQTDFSEPGELGLFIDESQISMLEAQMARTGYLRADQMAGAFQMLRSYDLLWSRLVNEYLLGQRRPLNDLMAWNADATRMPARMHAQYLRRLFLNNDLAQNRYPVGGRAVMLADLRQPIFAVATERDHVAPWRSVYKLHHLSPAALTFVLASGGHNAGIVSEPGHPRRAYRILERAAHAASLPPDDWCDQADRHEGSWWPAWVRWLDSHSGPARARPPGMGAPRLGLPVLGAAPGAYVLEK